MHDKLVYDIALSKIDGIGSVMFRQLINTFGSAEVVFQAPATKLLKIPNFGKTTLDKLKANLDAFKEAEKVVTASAREDIKIVIFSDERYPTKLKNIYEAPPILFFKGNGNLKFNKVVALVGTREASEYGKKVTDEIVEQLAICNVQIVSGLAYGIDVAAHKAALKYGLSTVAVLANSLDQVYPAAHKKYAKEIEESGLLISENAVGSKLSPSFFIARNRIIAGLSDAVFVVESAKKGGSMVTAEFANNYHREVFAVPGGLNQKYSEGPNYLISKNKAQIFTDVQSFCENMNWDSENEEIPLKAHKENLDLTHFSLEESKILSLLMQNGQMLIDDLSWQSQIPLNKLASILLSLEFQDLLVQSPGKKFRLK
jgi:DNA processing protein